MGYRISHRRACLSSRCGGNRAAPATASRPRPCVGSPWAPPPAAASCQVRNSISSVSSSTTLRDRLAPPSARTGCVVVEDDRTIRARPGRGLQQRGHLARVQRIDARVGVAAHQHHRRIFHALLHVLVRRVGADERETAAGSPPSRTPAPRSARPGSGGSAACRAAARCSTARRATQSGCCVSTAPTSSPPLLPPEIARRSRVVYAVVDQPLRRRRRSRRTRSASCRACRPCATPRRSSPPPRRLGARTRRPLSTQNAASVDQRGVSVTLKPP